MDFFLVQQPLFCKDKIPRLKLCKTCRMPFVPDADVGTDDLTAEGCGAWSCVKGLAAVKRHGQVCADGSLGGLTRIGVDAAGQIDGQHEWIYRKAVTNFSREPEIESQRCFRGFISWKACSCL